MLVGCKSASPNSLLFGCPCLCVCVGGGGLKTIIQVFLDILKSLSMFCFYKQLDLASQLNFCMHTLCFPRMYFWESHGSYFFRSFHSITRFPFPTAVQRTDFWQAEMGDWGVRGIAPTQKRCHFHTKVRAPSECWPEFPECGSPGHKKSALGHIASAQLLWFGWAGLLFPSGWYGDWDDWREGGLLVAALSVQSLLLTDEGNRKAVLPLGAAVCWSGEEQGG